MNRKRKQRSNIHMILSTQFEKQICFFRLIEFDCLFNYAKKWHMHFKTELKTWANRPFSILIILYLLHLCVIHPSFFTFFSFSKNQYFPFVHHHFFHFIFRRIELFFYPCSFLYIFFSYLFLCFLFWIDLSLLSARWRWMIHASSGYVKGSTLASV